jgi:hypothetical protein
MPCRPRLHTWLVLAEDIDINARILRGRGMQLLLKHCLYGRRCSGSFGVRGSANASALNSQCLVHDRAASRNELEIGDGAATGGMVGGGRKGAQGCRRGLPQEGAHGPRLMQKRLHVELLGSVGGEEERADEGRDGWAMKKRQKSEVLKMGADRGSPRACKSTEMAKSAVFGSHSGGCAGETTGIYGRRRWGRRVS